MWGIGFNEVWTSDEEFEIHPFSLYSYGLDHVEGCHTHVPGQTLKEKRNSISAWTADHGVILNNTIRVDN